MSQQPTINNNPNDKHQQQQTNPLLLLSTSEIKSQLSLLNQQLLLSLLSHITIHSNTTGVDTNPQQQQQEQQQQQQQQQQQPSSPSSSTTNQIELIKIISQLEHNCDEMMKKEMNIYKQQIECEEQRLQVVQKEIDIEMKCKVKMLDIERREFELTKKEFYSQQQHQPHLQQHQQPHQQPSQDQQSLILPSSTTSSTSSLIELSTTETSISNIQQQHQQLHQCQPSSSSLFVSTEEQTTSTTSTIQSMMGLLQHVIDDYQAMKYLVEQSTTTQQSLQQQYLTFNQSMNNVKNLNDKLESSLSKVNEFELQLQQFQQSLSEQSTLNESININDSNQKQTTNLIEQQRASLPVILKQNCKLSKSRSNNSRQLFIAFAFENLPGVNMSCGSWSDFCLHYVFYNCLIDTYLKTDLQQHKSTIQNSKLFISSKSVLNGEWIQIQGVGKVIDIKDLQLFSLLKDGDNIYDYNDYPCTKSCDYCAGTPSHTKRNRFLIKFKWE